MVKIARILPLLLLAAPAYAQVPNAPQNVTQTVTGTTVTLQWSAPSGGGAPTGYRVEAAVTPGGAIVATLDVPGTTLTVPNVPLGVYFVQVRGVNGAGAGAPSGQVTVSVGGGSTGCPGPPLPPNLIVESNALQVNITWGSSGGCAPTSWVLSAGTGPGLSNVAVVNAGAGLGLATPAPPGNYYVRVAGTNAFGTNVSPDRLLRVASNAQTATVSANGAAALDFTMAQTGNATFTLVWENPAQDLDLYLAGPGCPYPPQGTCLLAISDATGTNAEAVARPVTAGQPLRIWVDNFSTQATSFTVLVTIGAALPSSAPVEAGESATAEPIHIKKTKS